MNGYRYWVERHKLAIWLDKQKAVAAQKPAQERQKLELAAEADFRHKLDALYAEVHHEFEAAKA